MQITVTIKSFSYILMIHHIVILSRNFNKIYRILLYTTYFAIDVEMQTCKTAACYVSDTALNFETIQVYFVVLISHAS